MVGVLSARPRKFLRARHGRAQTQDGAAVSNPPPPALALPAERRILLKHHWTGEELSVVYRVGDAYQPQALASISRLLRDYRCNKIVPIDPKLIDLLYELSEELKPRGPVRVISGYRSEGYNASLLRAGRTVDPDSQHTLGHVVDVIFPGVRRTSCARRRRREASAASAIIRSPDRCSCIWIPGRYASGWSAILRSGGRSGWRGGAAGSRSTAR